MNVRTIVLIVAALGIPLALAVLALPITWGYGGYFAGPQRTGHQSWIWYIDPHGPAYAAGLRAGQHVTSPTGAEFIREAAGPAGTVAHLRVIRNGTEHVLNVTFVPFTGSLAVQQLIDKVVDALTALAAFAIAILVLLRAKDERVGTRAATVLVLAGAGGLAQGGALVCGDAFLAFGLARLLLPLGAATLWAGLALLAVYPPQQTAVRRFLVWAGPLAMLLAFASDAAILFYVQHGYVSPVLLPFFPDRNGIGGRTLLGVLFWCTLAASCVDAMVKARANYAPAVRWLCGLWLLGIAFRIAPNVLSAAGVLILGSHYGDVLNAGFVACLASGVAYPILRHRLVDLNILVSRATVFTTVSLIIVGIFVAAEWAVGKIFEQSFGFSNEHGGLAAQLVTLGVVLVLGISARSIHRFVDDRMTNTFFRKRLAGLKEIEDAAHEADAATDPRAVVEIAVATVQRCLNPLGTALYLLDGNRYERVASSGQLNAPAAYGYNDVPPLKLRRWLKPFEATESSEAMQHMIFVPMLVRGDLAGFLVCGPKEDHTAYLQDEIAALALLAHHAGLAQALLSKASRLPPLTLA